MRPTSIVTLTIVLLAACGLIYSEAKLIVKTPIHAWTQSQSGDCAVVLTGGPGRLQEGLNFLYTRKTKKLILSGVNKNSHLEEIYPNLVFYGEINPKDIILEKTSLTTFGNAHKSLALVEALQCSDVVLITSKVHMHRALKTFRSIFPAHINIQARATVGKSYRASWWTILTETLKSLFYRVWLY